jgi:hypothetical protein
MMPIEAYTHSSLSTFRTCPRKFELQYVKQLSPDWEDAEALQVGTCWHKAQEARVLKGNLAAYNVIAETAPSDVWRAKLSAMMAGYLWFYSSYELDFIEPESTFEVEICGVKFRGQRDGVLRVDDGIGVLEYKTTSQDISATGRYWDRLRLDVQVSIYGRSMPEMPRHIVYDVARKPTINPKKLTKRDLEEIPRGYYLGVHLAEQLGEELAREIMVLAEDENLERETPELYGIRLLEDIQKRPDFYFARSIVTRTVDDYRELERDLDATIAMVETCEAQDFYPRNPDSCTDFSGCVFAGLCERHQNPEKGEAPQGFVIREALHQELS